MDQGSIQRRQAGGFKARHPCPEVSKSESLKRVCRRHMIALEYPLLGGFLIIHDTAVSVGRNDVIHILCVLFFVFYMVFPPKLLS